MLSVENLDVFHGDAQALDDVSLEIAEGAIVAIVAESPAAGADAAAEVIVDYAPFRR